MSADRMDLLQGTLELLVLKALSQESRHGYSIMRWIRDASGEELQIEEGALYPALHRMEAKDWVSADWGVSENNRRAKFYDLTPKGRRQLERAESKWARYVRAIARVLEAPAAE